MMNYKYYYGRLGVVYWRCDDANTWRSLRERYEPGGRYRPFELSRTTINVKAKI
jgi:hypothetical protein